MWCVEVIEMILIIFAICLHHLNAESVRVQLHPVSKADSVLSYLKIFQKSLQNLWMNLWKDDNTPAAEQLKNYENFQYYGEVMVGTPPQKLRVLFDTGSTDTWFPSRNCWPLDALCWVLRFYDSSKSSTYKPNGTNFEVYYMDSSYYGFWSMDTIQINSLVIHQQAFAQVTNIFNADFLTNQYDGIIGMSCRNISPYGNIPVVPNMFAENKEMDAVFSFYLSRKDGEPVGGELVLGGINPEHFTGEFESLPTTSQTSWVVQMKSIKINGMEYFDETYFAAMDTGTSLIVGPSKIVNRINSQLGAKLSVTGDYVINCNDIHTLPPIEFTFKRRTYVLQAKDYIVKQNFWLFSKCLSPFNANDNLIHNLWILGDVFMGKFYTVFDFGESQIRLADVDDD
ncbi:unnamed protein product [Trichobilharzia szidati]|nr:unnamed protein product [Trichobilharzia szidati]